MVQRTLFLHFISLSSVPCKYYLIIYDFSTCVIWAYFHTVSIASWIAFSFIKKCMDVSSDRAFQIWRFMEPEQISIFHRLDRFIYIKEGYL